MPKQGNSYYTSSEDNSCFKLSLCNLLLEMGDSGMAEKVSRTYYTHRYTEKGKGVNSHATSIIVRELTKGAYDAKLHIFMPPANASHFREFMAWQSCRDDAEGGIHAAIIREMEAGRIVEHPYCLNQMKLPSPTILTLPVKAEEKDAYHAIVYACPAPVKHMLVIDNGHPRMLDSRGLLVWACLEVKRNGQQAKRNNSS